MLVQKLGCQSIDAPLASYLVAKALSLPLLAETLILRLPA
jgi:hypothetical protein